MDLKSFSELLSHVFLPKSCPLCGEPGTYVCRRCLDRVLSGPAPAPRCLKCGERTPCAAHGRRYELRSRVWHEDEARELILAAKYSGVGRLALILGQEMACLLPSGAWTVAVIPPHRRRSLMPTGGTHLDWMSRGLTTSAALSARSLLRWRYRVPPQKGRRDAAERRALPEDCFECAAPVPERVLLLDDVSTTGTTLLRAATCLYAGGAREVVCLSFSLA